MNDTADVAADPSPLAEKPRSPRPWWIRHRLTFLFAAALAVAVVLGLRWAKEPADRRFVLFEAPLRLVEGERVTGTFESEREGRFPLAIQFPREQAAEDLFESFRASRFQNLPAELRISYTIRDPEGHETHGVSGDHPMGWWSDGTDEGLEFEIIEDGRRGRYEVEAHVDRASARLARYSPSLVVRADWIDLRFKAVAARTIEVVGGALVVLTVWVLVAVIVASRRRSRDLEASLDSASSD